MKTVLETIKTLSHILSMVLVFAIIINLLAFYILQKNTGDNPVIAKYGLDNLKSAYPELSREAVGDLLNETWHNQVVYSSYVQFKEPSRTGTYVNISANGFRLNQSSHENPLPLRGKPLNIFVFGGSTTFGYGVPDSQTIPAYLEVLLREKNIDANVYNFGRAFYFSLQERILFEKLLIDGHTPNIAIFIDGLNEFYHDNGEPTYTGFLKGSMDNTFYAAQKKFFRELPIVNLVRLGRDTLQRQAPQERAGQPQVSQAAETEKIKQIINRYLSSTKMIKALSTEYQLKTLFVWQPVPDYYMDLTTHPFYDNDDPQVAVNRKIGFSLAKDLFKKDLPEIIWAAEIAKTCKGNFIDKVHYSAQFNKLIAKKIFSQLNQDNQAAITEGANLP